jgi:hypothetical protein
MGKERKGKVVISMICRGYLSKKSSESSKFCDSIASPVQSDCDMMFVDVHLASLDAVYGET